MAAPSKIDAARTAPDRRARIATMASIMRDTADTHGSCDRPHLRAAGFTEAEIEAYADDAREILSDRKGTKVLTPTRAEGRRLVARARAIRARAAGTEVRA